MQWTIVVHMLADQMLDHGAKSAIGSRKSAKSFLHVRLIVTIIDRENNDLSERE